MAGDGTTIGALAVRIGADATDLVREFGKAGKETEKLGEKFSHALKASAAFATGMAAAGVAVAALISRTAQSADELGKMAQKVGVSVEALSGLKYAAQLSDVSLDQLGTGLKQLSKHMVENGVQGVSVEEQLLRIADEFAGAADGANKTAVAMKYFGRSGADMIPLLNQGRAGIEEMRKEAERLGVVISRDAAEAAEKFNDNMTRLRSSAEGVTIELAGPLVKALGDAAGKFLEARREGEGFFEAMKRGIQDLLTGSDLQKWEKDMAEAGETLLSAQNKLDSLRRSAGGEFGGVGEFGEETLAEAKAAVAAAEARIRLLRTIKPIIAPEAPATDRPAGQLALPEDQGQAQRDAALAGRQWQEAADEEVRIRAEVAQLMADYRAAELERERAFQATRNQILIEAYEREQEEAIRQGQELLEIGRQKEQGLIDLGYRHRQLTLGAAKTFFGSMSQLMNTQSKKMFEIGKAAAIAETVINTHAMAVASYRALAGIPIVGPALGAAAAAAAIGYGVAQVSQIRSQSFGSGGGAAPVAAANPTTGAPVGTPGDVGRGGRGGPDTIIHLHGETVGREQLRKLFEQINETGRDGGRLVFV